MKWQKLALFLLLLGCSALPALAHGYVLRAIPADRSTLARPPTRLQYWFSEDLEPRFSEINLRDQTGSIIASGGVDKKNHALLSLPVPPDLPNGAYIAELRPAFASDGHVVVESRVFFVGEEVGGVAGSAADDRAIPLEVLWRATLNLANFLFFGASLFYSAVLLPAWGNPRYPAGGLPPRVMDRLRFCLIAALSLAVGANIVALLQQTMVFFDADVRQVIEQNLWQVVLLGSRFGDVWTFRFVLLVFSAVLIFVSVYYRQLMPGLASGIWRGMPWLGALLIGLSMVTSHAAGSLLLPWVAIAVDWLHALATAFWLGGALTLVLLIPPALAPYQGERRIQALRAVLLRFSRIVTLLVALVILSGIYNALNYFVTPADLATSYGRSLGFKLLLVLPLLILGGWQHVALRPQLAARMQPVLGRLPQSMSSWVARATALRLEVLLMLATLVAVAWLSATPIPEPQSLQAEVETPQATQSIGEYTLSSAIIPGGPGVNTYDLLLKRADQPVTDAQIYLQMVHPELGMRSAWQKTEQVEKGLYVLAGDDVDQAGSWWTLVDIVLADGQSMRVAQDWEISDSAAIQQSREPGLIHWLMLFTIGVALVAMVYPRARRLVAGWQVSAVSGLLALGMAVLSIGIMGFGAFLISEQQRNYELTLNPPPAIINTVLPDAASLQLGAALYREYCLVWQGQSADFRALRGRLDSARDDFLYQALGEGWRNLPSCAGDLSEAQRWHIVNYFRSFEERAE